MSEGSKRLQELPSRLLQICFLASGAAGLMHEVPWTRMPESVHFNRPRCLSRLGERRAARAALQEAPHRDARHTAAMGFLAELGGSLG